jgi:hypothetical protein
LKKKYRGRIHEEKFFPWTFREEENVVESIVVAVSKKISIAIFIKKKYRGRIHERNKYCALNRYVHKEILHYFFLSV